ncbi:MAG: hypothetical protein IJS52_10980 [Bacilli bacterium]|nr:hypothetical protein [Bacilli bacterium]
MFRKVRRGETRILLGSTFKLGIGVNVQDNLIALHHLDVPWRPSDMVQREGRILRQGNQNESVHIYRYVTQGSFDAYSWQLLETKQRFISALLSGQMGQRDGQDMSNEALSYAEVKALAVGNPIIKERIEVANELARYLFLQRSLTQSRQDAAEEHIALCHRIASINEQIVLCEEDAVFAKTLEKASKEIRAEMRQRLQKALIQADMSPKETSIGTYSGFEVVLPAGMLPDKPFCFLRRKGSYEVKLGREEAGNLVRIDNFIARFDDYLAELRQKVIELKNLAAQAKKTSEEVGDYSGNIDQCRKKLADIDKKLGVIK